MIKSSSTAAGKAATVYGNLMLAPMVIAMRVPLLASEAGPDGNKGVETMRAITEKTSALFEGAMAAQASLMKASLQFWPDVVAGRTPSLLTGEAAGEAMTAAFEKSGTTVRANFKRLSGLRRGL
ncbi:hypothetical protein QBK99_11655 [Corticibacterium sp. UT-5YL-CI-8]|nr:hypothetical protein [Tianweitania sp. UT-5YL-CI-8]